MNKRFFSSQIRRKFGSVRDLPEWLSEYPKDVADQIKLIRETLGMTQKQLAKRARYSLRFIQSIEMGRSAPIATISKIAGALNAELKVFIIPRQDLQEYLEEIAAQKAGMIVGISQASSSMERQAPSDETKAEQVESVKRKILEKRRSSLWD